MARIAGVNIPTDKRALISLTYIKGIGLTSAKKICEQVGLDEQIRVKDMTEDQLTRIRDIIANDFIVEGDLRRQVSMDIKRKQDLKTYQGLRHRKNLPVRGQRTHTNARTRKGPAKPIAGKKK